MAYKQLKALISTSADLQTSRRELEDARAAAALSLAAANVEREAQVAALRHDLKAAQAVAAAAEVTEHQRYQALVAGLEVRYAPDENLYRTLSTPASWLMRL